MNTCYIFQNKDFYFFRKPHWIASTFGKEKSFLDYVFIENKKILSETIDYLDLNKNILKYINNQIKILNLDLIDSEIEKDYIIQNLINVFWEEKEFWLLNRLDNDTWGLLYFAKSEAIYDEYKIKQNKNLIQKFYITQVKGNPFFKLNEKEMIIDYPIMHHKNSKDRMICLNKLWKEKLWTWKKHLVKTKIYLLKFDSFKNISTLLVIISKWIRHQVRAHLSSIWCPIIWETIYHKQKSKDFLHLWSVWFK